MYCRDVSMRTHQRGRMETRAQNWSRVGMEWCRVDYGGGRRVAERLYVCVGTVQGLGVMGV